MMANVLVINFPGEGHINPTLAIISELIRRGETVVSYCIEDYRRRLRQQVQNSESLKIFSPKLILWNE